jgi:hypothetical protein
MGQDLVVVYKYMLTLCPNGWRKFRSPDCRLIASLNPVSMSPRLLLNHGLLCPSYRELHRQRNIFLQFNFYS